MNVATRIAACAALVFGASLVVESRALAHPSGSIELDREGNVFFIDTGKGVWKIDRDGRTTFVGEPAWHWMSVDDEGRYRRTKFANWFERATSEEALPAVIACSDFPCAIGSDGQLYYANTLAFFTEQKPTTLVRVAADGSERTVAGALSADKKPNLGPITGLTRGLGRTFYVTESEPATGTVIKKIAADGTVTTVINGKESKLLNSYCRGLAVDSRRNIFVAANELRKVLKISAEGKVEPVLGAEGKWSPCGVAERDGDVYVLEWLEPPEAEASRDKWIPRVRKLARDGSVSTLVTVSRD